MNKVNGTRSAAAFLVLVFGCGGELDTDTSRSPARFGRKDANSALLEEGVEAYTRYCSGCHGTSGDGNGPAAGFLHPRPRNFQTASFKFSSSRAGSLPTDDDLKRSIRQGLKGTAMPDWPLLSEHTVDALVAYIKTFSPKWKEKAAAPPIPMVSDPYRSLADKTAAVERGKEIYHGYAACWSCHPAYVSGEKINEYLKSVELSPRAGFRPNITNSEGKVSSEGELIHPPDFRRDFVRGGMSVDDLYRSIAAGITGTAMPTWVDSMDLKSSHGDVLVRPADLWAMAYYVRSLLQERPSLLVEGSYNLRRRPQTLYFNGEIPPPAKDPTLMETNVIFEEE